MTDGKHRRKHDCAAQLQYIRDLNRLLIGTKVSSTARAVFLTITPHANLYTAEALFTQEHIAELAGVTERQVRRLIRELEQAGLFAVRRTNGDANVYRFPLVRAKLSTTPDTQMSGVTCPQPRTSGVGTPDIQMSGEVETSSLEEGRSFFSPGSGWIAG